MNEKPHPLVVLLCLALAVAGAPAAADALKQEPASECVILLHGLGRTAKSMRRLENHLSDAGFAVLNVDYPSTKESLDTLVAEYVGTAVSACEARDCQRIHFVTHSLGGILVRQYLQDRTLPKGSRIVMLAPPNRGSELATKLANLAIYRKMTGPAGQVLGVDAESVPNTLAPVDAEIGIIAGTRSANPIYSAMIPGDDDSKVSVKNAKLKEMQDFIALPASHPFIMRKKVVINHVIHFLRHGQFAHPEHAL